MKRISSFLGDFLTLGRLDVDAWSRSFLLAAVGATLAQAAVLLIFQKELPPQVPLFYSLPWGEDRLTTPIWLWILPAVSGVTLIINLIGSHRSGELVLTRIFSAGAFLTAVLSLVTLVKIVALGLP